MLQLNCILGYPDPRSTASCAYWALGPSHMILVVPRPNFTFVFLCWCFYFLLLPRFSSLIPMPSPHEQAERAPLCLHACVRLALKIQTCDRHVPIHSSVPVVYSSSPVIHSSLLNKDSPMKCSFFRWSSFSFRNYRTQSKLVRTIPKI